MSDDQPQNRGLTKTEGLIAVVTVLTLLIVILGAVLQPKPVQPSSVQPTSFGNNFHSSPPPSSPEPVSPPALTDSHPDVKELAYKYGASENQVLAVLSASHKLLADKSIEMTESQIAYKLNLFSVGGRTPEDLEKAAAGLVAGTVAGQKAVGAE